jgi:hypothetical protein
MDHQVPAAITRGLRRRGVQVITALEDGTDRAGDELLLQRATHLRIPVFTMDDDFLVITHDWLKTGRHFAGLVYGYPLNLTIGQAVRDLELIAQVMDEADMLNRIEFIPF